MTLEIGLIRLERISRIGLRRLDTGLSMSSMTGLNKLERILKTGSRKQEKT